MARFNDAWMDLLLASNDIVSVVSSYVMLKSKGRNMWGLCPFHNEKTASFSVAPDKQMYYCFGCGAGGGVVQFVMEMEHLPYMEAVEFLARRAGMELPSQIDDAQLQRERARKERLYAACKAAAQMFHQNLCGEAGATARAYLANRGLDAAVVKRFGMGYALDGWENLKVQLMEAGFTEEELLDAGLLVKNQKSGRVYDAYRNRIIFPIIGTNARVLGFGARAMGDEMPKYINTSETPIYNKRRHLFGLNLQKGVKLADLIVVEGYMDVIGLYAAGVRNAVASLGTSLTEQQARLLKRYVSSVYIAYDGDAAGQNATLRGLDILQKEEMDVRVIVLPEGIDPDEFVRANGPEAFDALKDAALTLNGFKLARMASAHKLETEDGRQAYALQGCKFIAGLQPVEQERYYVQLARATGLPLQTLREQGAKDKAAAQPTPAGRTAAAGRARRQQVKDERALLERSLIKAMVQAPACMDKLEGHPLEHVFEDPHYLAFAKALLDVRGKGQKVNVAVLLGALPPEQAQGVAEALEGDVDIREPMQFVADCLQRIERVDAMAHIQALQAKLQDDNATLEEKRATMEEISAWKKRV